MNIINPGFQVKWSAVVGVWDFYIFVREGDGVSAFQKNPCCSCFVGIALRSIFDGDFHQHLCCGVLAWIPKPNWSKRDLNFGLLWRDWEMTKLLFCVGRASSSASWITIEHFLLGWCRLRCSGWLNHCRRFSSAVGLLNFPHRHWNWKISLPWLFLIDWIRYSLSHLFQLIHAFSWAISHCWGMSVACRWNTVVENPASSSSCWTVLLAICWRKGL